MEQSQAVEPKPAPVPRNGVDTPSLFATINAVKEKPELAKFRFRATNRWIKGTHSQGRIESFSGAGGDHAHSRAFEYEADHPKVLVGGDEGPTPVEFVLHALAACLTAGIANVAAARGVTLREVESTVEGDMNLLGILGLLGRIQGGRYLKPLFGLMAKVPFLKRQMEKASKAAIERTNPSSRARSGSSSPTRSNSTIPSRRRRRCHASRARSARR